MSSAIAALIGLVLAIVLIIKKLSPVYSLMIGALAGGLLSGWGLGETINLMLSGVNDITPAVLRILAAGVLSGSSATLASPATPVIPVSSATSPTPSTAAAARCVRIIRR